MNNELVEGKKYLRKTYQEAQTMITLFGPIFAVWFGDKKREEVVALTVVIVDGQPSVSAFHFWEVT
jgi:hypothetical protein